MGVDWTVVQQQYEQGASLRDIVARHGSSIATISRIARHEGWERPVTPIEIRKHETVKHETSIPPPPVSPSVSMPSDAISIARTGLAQLDQHLKSKGEPVKDILSIASHKLLSDALSQYVKILAMAPQESQDGFVILFEELLPQTVDVIRQALVEDERLQRVRSEEGAS